MTARLTLLILSHTLLVWFVFMKEAEGCAVTSEQDIIDCLPTLTLGGTVTVTADMNITQVITLTLAANLSLQSMAGSSFTLTFDVNGQFAVAHQVPMNCTTKGADGEYHFSNLQFRGGPRSSPIIDINGATHVSFTGCDFRDFSLAGPAVSIVGPSTAVLFQNVSFNSLVSSNDAVVLIELDYLSPCPGVEFYDCFFFQNDGGALKVTAPAVTLSGCQFSGNRGLEFLDVFLLSTVNLLVENTHFIGVDAQVAASSMKVQFFNLEDNQVANITWSGLSWTNYSFVPGENVNPAVSFYLGSALGAGSLVADSLTFSGLSETTGAAFYAPTRISPLDFQLELTNWQMEITNVWLSVASITIQNIGSAGLSASLRGLQLQSTQRIEATGLDYFELTNSTFQNGNAGALFITDTPNVFLNNLVVDSDTGSSIFEISPCQSCSAFNFTMTDTTITNSANFNAPIRVGFEFLGLSVEPFITLNFHGLTLFNCSGGNTGGIFLDMLSIMAPSVDLVLTNSSFSLCQSLTEGGALSLAFPRNNLQQQNPIGSPMLLVVQNSWFNSNTAVNAGGAIYMYTNASELAFQFLDDSFIANCAFVDNTINYNNFGPLWSNDTLTIDESACFITMPTSTFSIPTQSTSSTLSTSTTTTTITTTTTTTTSTTTTTAPVNDTRYICLNVDPPIYVQSPADCVVASSCPSFRCCSGACVDRPDLCLDPDSFCSSKANTPCGYSLSSGSDQICWDYCPSSNSNSSKVCLQNQWPDCESSSLIQYTPCPGSFNVVPFVAPVEQVDIPVFDYSGVVIAQITLSTGNSSDVVIVESYQPNSTKAQKKVAKLRSPALSITLASGQTKDLVLTITLVLNSDGNNTKYRVNDLCLAYVEDNESDNWKCEDFNLEWMEVNGSVYVVGKSDHLTNFAALLGGGSLHQDFGYTIASLALIGGAIVLGLLICFFPPLSRLFYGKRGYAAKEIRSDIAHGKYDSPSSSHGSTAASTTSTVAVAVKTEGGEDRSSSSSDPSKSASSSASPFLDLPIVTCEDDI